MRTISQAEAISPSERIILRTLLNGENSFVSGSTLANLLGVSRVAVWQHMEKLRSTGFVFQAVRAKGYRITERPSGLSGPYIEALLDNAGVPCPVILLDEVDSTNDEASRLLASDRPAPFVVVARSQRRGRGRFGRVWNSRSEGNLYASFAFHPKLEPARMSPFSLWMGLATCRMLASISRHKPMLKWPNDIMFEGRKTAGLLTEARMDTDMIRDLVFGIGLNLAETGSEQNTEPSYQATCLAAHANQDLDINQVLARLIEATLAAYDAFCAGTHKDAFADLWNDHDLLRQREITILRGNERVTGLASGVDEAGALLLRDDTGRLHRFLAGEVSIDKNSL